jgi:transposase
MAIGKNQVAALRFTKRSQFCMHRDPTAAQLPLRWVNRFGCAIREAIEAAGAKLLYLPPYSPDFNPIEQIFAKLKALLRKAAERSVEGLWNRIACLLNAFLPDECANYFRNSGYAAC